MNKLYTTTKQYASIIVFLNVNGLISLYFLSCSSKVLQKNDISILYPLKITTITSGKKVMTKLKLSKSFRKQTPKSIKRPLWLFVNTPFSLLINTNDINLNINK